MRHAVCTPYRLNEVERVWLRNRCPGREALIGYKHWVRRFAAYCETHSLDQRAELTQCGAERFARWWRLRGSRRRGQLKHAMGSSHSALRAWAFSLTTLGESLPPWRAEEPPAAFDPRFKRFADYLREVRGNKPSTIHLMLTQLMAFDAYRRSRGTADKPIRLPEIDEYVVACRRRYSRWTVANICTMIRGYLRFLHTSGLAETSLASSVMAPKVRVAERPYRTLPWGDVQRILRAVDRSTAAGRRDYALLLMMSVYGLGAGEVIGLSLDDVDWQAAVIRVRRPKTNVVLRLPLLPAVARALADYLKRGRPARTLTRHLFVTLCMPLKGLAASVSVRNILHKAARRAGVTAPFLGTHAFRHTHASRQLELGTPPKIIGDILGHRDPESTSVYLRVASERLRELSLPVPQ
jgi:integrase/recombinase XerD